MADFKRDHYMKSKFDKHNDERHCDIRLFSQALPTEIDIFAASSKSPACVEPKTNLENVKLRCTIGDSAALLYLPDDTSSTPTISAFFHIMRELLSVGQSEYKFSGAAAKAAECLRRTEQRSRAFSSGIWPPMFELLQQIPPEHFAIQRLVDFLAELKKIRVETLQIWGHDIRLWSDLPLFVPEFVEQCEQDTGDYEKSSLKALQDLLEVNDVYILFDYSKVKSKTA